MIFFYIWKRICTYWKSCITFLLLIFLKFRRPFPHCVLTETITLLNSKFEDSIKFYSNQDQSFFAWFKNINHGYAAISLLINTKSPLNCRLIFNCLLQLKNLLLKVWNIGYAEWMKIRYLPTTQFTTKLSHMAKICLSKFICWELNS